MKTITLQVNEDIHTVNPCFNCGGRVKQHGAGKWSGVWSNGFFSGGWSDGEWLIRTDR